MEINILLSLQFIQECRCGWNACILIDWLLFFFIPQLLTSLHVWSYLVGVFKCSQAAVKCFIGINHPDFRHGPSASIRAHLFQPYFPVLSAQWGFTASRAKWGRNGASCGSAQCLHLTFLAEDIGRPNAAACQRDPAWLRNEVWQTWREVAFRVILYLLSYRQL